MTSDTPRRNMISELRQRVQHNGTATITTEEYNQLQAEWITRAGISVEPVELTTANETIARLETEKAQPEAMNRDLQHERSCDAWTDQHGYENNIDECTCGLLFRKRIVALEAAHGTEQTMHAAWRKRAEESEAQLATKESELLACRAEWQSIETAPKDGTPILVYTRSDCCYVVAYDEDFSAPWRVRNDEGLNEAVPTNWMPLPNTPAIKAGAQS